MDGALGLPLHGGVDDAPSDTVHEEDADEGALVVYVCALGHHGQQVGVEALRRREKLLRTSGTSWSPRHGEPWRAANPEFPGLAAESGFWLGELPV